ncbi:MAG: polyribonucleotide nucleotidyltransferase [Proteobacteria bacterium]|nr:polyribonucleotide nucleotidyltransferase [Pseudomonadota bacterium]MBU1639081.1 polyribonucleotide nucleotidyltransferase [Pseudomonadota bacterium]
MYKKVEVEIGGRPLTIETGKMAKQASGSVVVTYGETVVLVTVVGAKDAKPDADFLPLTVEYQERFYAVGKIPGSFFRREIGRPTEKETLTCRFIDRPLRPLFADGYACETQIIATVISADKENDADLLAMIGASASLSISHVPFMGPVAGVRVGMIDGKYVINPTTTQQKESVLDLIVAGTKKAVVMVEGGADMLSEDVVLDAIYAGHEALKTIIAVQEEMQAAVGVAKMVVVPPQVDAKLQKQVADIAAGPMEKVITTSDKMERYAAFDELKGNVVAKFEEDPEFSRQGEVKSLLKELQKSMMRSRIVEKGERIGGRKFDEVRKIDTEVALLPRVHGSALFTRGETQALVTTTLGSGDDEQRVETLDGMSFRKFMLHYNFPPFCVGEARFMRGPSRRDIGHGALATRALEKVLPSIEDFPYTIRIVSDILESNGSSSMASVCGGSLSLMDAGVPIKAPVSGVAMGLIKDGDKVVVLTDILGDEDHLGDMDFKVTGTADGITALQMDIKIEGVTREIMTTALAQAKAGRIHILGEMAKSLTASRAEMPAHAPKIITMHINPDKIRDLIGPGGKIIRGIQADLDVKIDVDDSGTVKIFAADGVVAQQAQDRVNEVTAEAEIGKIYEGVVKTIVDFGAFVEILPGTDGLVHISELANGRVEKVTDVLKEGDKLKVKVLAVDQRGKIRLSRKACLEE